MTIDRAAAALLELVAADRDAKCAALEGDAAARAGTLLAAAHEAARARIRATFAEERARMAARVGAAQAKLATMERLAEQRRAAALVAAGWLRLPQALVAAWRDPSMRQDWVERIRREGEARLPRGAWRIAHAADWPAAEREALAPALAEAGVTAAFVADPGVAAGFRISAGGNVLDGTLAGLTNDREQVGALLLSELEGKEST